MNTSSQKKVTKRKVTKIKTDNDAAEVFVLPPNLLEQLGINLTNIGSAPESNKESKVTDINNISKEKGGGVNRHTHIKHSLENVSTPAEMQSSIIETAELMKKSVFLSPTFISNNTNVIQGEIEIVGNAECEKLNEDVNFDLVNKHSKFENSEEVQISAETVSDEHEANSIPISLSAEENKEWDKAANADVEMQTLIDDHADEAYSSDCSNSNIGCSVSANINKSNPNKINIISEQIILPSQMYKYESGYSSQENNLVHIPIDTVIKSQKKDTVCHPRVINMDVVPSLIVNKQPSEKTVNECTIMYEEHCANENIDIPTLDSESMQNIVEIDGCHELNETVSDFIITPCYQNKLRQDSVILQMSPKTNTIIKDNVIVNSDITIPWHVDTDEVRNSMDKTAKPIENGTSTGRHNEHNEDGFICSSKVVSTDSCVDRSSMLNITSRESKSEMVEDDVTLISYVNDLENEYIKYPPLENKILHTSQTTDAIIRDNVIVETGITIPCQVDTGDVSKLMKNKGKEVGDGTNTGIYNEYNKGEEKENSKIITTDLCVDGNQEVTSILNITPHESKSQIITMISQISDVENADKNIKNLSLEETHHSSFGDLKSPRKNNIHAEPLNRYFEVLPNNELKTTLQKSDEELMPIQNGNFSQKDIFVANAQHTINEDVNCEKSLTTAEIEKNNFVNKNKCSRDTSQMKHQKQFKRDKNAHLIEPMLVSSTQSPILKVHGKQESDDIHCKHKEPHKYSESNVKISINENSLCGNDNVKGDKVNKAPIILDDKVREIAQYLSKIADLKKRKNINSKQKLSSISFNNKKHTINSKSSIHGVEKPGGSGINNEQIINYPPIKTYEPKRRQICKPAPSLTFKVPNTLAQSISLTDFSSSSNISNEVEFCLCYDFGRLLSYDDESSYEHLHFWNNTRTDCTLDVIFSIYSEDTSGVASENNVQGDKHEYPSESSATTVRKLCWNEMKLLNENGLDDVYDKDFNVETKEEKYYLETGENISSNVNLSFFEIECTESEENKNETTTVNVLQNGELKPDNKMVAEELSEKTKKKRKCSITPRDNDEPPVKKYGSISKQLKEGLECSNKYRISANNAKTPASIEDSCGNALSTSYHGMVTDPVEEQSASLNKGTRIERQPSLIVDDASTSSTEKSFTTPINSVDQPFKTAETMPIPVEQPKIPAYVATNQSSSSVNDYRTIICGVCQQSVENVDWIKHIASQHNYLAWKCGEPSLDVADEAAVRDHLSHISKACGGLKCVKCGLTRKQVKAFLNHIRQCPGLAVSSSDVDTEVKNEMLYVKNEQESGNSELIKCGVCEESMQNCDWNDHIALQHDYLAWKDGEPSLDVNDEEVVRERLYQITKAIGGLTCARCGLTRKYVKAYLSHIRSCSGLSDSQNDRTYQNDTSEITSEEKSTSANSNTDKDAEPANTDFIKCGVCEESIHMEDWNDHIASRHDYLAWIQGGSPLDVNDEAAVREHLHVISKRCGGLTCGKCGLTRKHAKPYLSHIKSCNGLSESQNDSAYNVSTDVRHQPVELPIRSITHYIDQEQEASIDMKLVECGVCKEILQDKDWYNHIASQHDYMAWKLGEPALDVNDAEAVKDHLYAITKACGGLTCSKCGLTRKYVKSYLTHFKNCDGPIDVNDNSACVDSTLEPSTNVGQVTPATGPELVKCGVCGQYTESNDWAQHLASNHEYLAWRDGEPSFNVNDEAETCLHLQNLIKEIGALSCPKCGLQQKCVKSYLHHIRICGDKQEDKNYDDHLEKVNDTQIAEANSFKCGVCHQMIDSSSWLKHLSEEHNYLAWKDGDAPPDLNDEDEVYRHLYNYAKEFGSLVCKHCGKGRKNVKGYLTHIKTCNQDVSRKEEANTTDAMNSTLNLDDSVVDFTSAATCAVCHKEVEAGQWIQHTQKEHNYLAWREGEKPWDLDDYSDVNQYLYAISKRMDGLTCNKCGLVRKYVKTFLTHIKNCNATNLNHVVTVEPVMNKDMYQCAMCKELIKPTKWNTHAMEKHYNVTWIVGQTPIDIRNPYVVERYIKDYRQMHGNLKCRTCGATRASCSGFYAHIITCGKSEEEIDMHKEVCHICNNKYLCIYRNQHAMAHKVQSYSAELKLKKEVLKEEKEEATLDTSGKRRAAVKARSVIENYSNTMSKHLHTCQSCGFGTDFKDELKKHKCQVSNEKDFSGDESSAAEIGSSGDESPDSDVDSNISNEVNDDVEDENDGDEPREPQKKLRYREPAPIVSKFPRIPFEVGDPTSYIEEGDAEFVNTHLCDEVLFPLWRCEPETVPESELQRYLPPLEKSCQFKSSSGWTTLARFEAKKDANGTSIFVGASIVCVAWVPLRVEHIDSGGSNFLAVACHNGPDCPRYQGDETPTHGNMIQIWNYSTFKVLPELSFGIAHEFGIVWSMDWCPSGARDPTPVDGDTPTPRLGLLAVACSSGSAYVFAVPCPAADGKSNPLVHKLNPVAELRMNMSLDRKRYQATSVSWSKQKGHNIVLVGYADGSLAYYDLHSTSPLLCTTENDVQVFYPYHDERAHNTCITGTDLYPAAGLGAGAGAGACASAAPTGAYMTARAGAGAGAGAGGRARLHVAALGIAFAPHAASAVLVGDDAIMHTTRSELVWVQPGRRLGSVRAAAGCSRCGRLAVSMPPTLRLMRPHPAYPDPKKLVVGVLEMTHLAKKRKQVNDELAMRIEPLTYAEAAGKYGIEFHKITKIDRTTQQQYATKPKSHYPERFPLADVKSLAFCPSRKYHDRLAVATHSGILFLITVD